MVSDAPAGLSGRYSRSNGRRVPAASRRSTDGQSNTKASGTESDLRINMTHSLVMRLSNSNPHTSGAQPPLPPKPAAHPRQSRRQENRSRLRGSPAANICATPAAIPTREYVRLQIGVKERCRPKAGALCHCPLPLPLPPTLPPPLALAAPPAVRQGQTPKRHAYLRTCNVCIRRVNRVCPVCVS